MEDTVVLRRSNAPPPGGNRPRQRAALVLAGLAALALPCTPLAAETAEPGRFTPPAEPLLLTRTVIRPLRDGAEIVVVRRYRIRFVPQDSGYRLDGELVGSAVEAPPALASLAALLREQPEPGPFPAAVDRAGMILPAPAGADRAPGRAGAVAAAGALLAHNGAGTAPELRAALQTMATATPGSGWPAFLFNPGPGGRIERRAVLLADGSQGEVEVQVTVGPLLGGGLPGEVRRTVTTRLGGIEQATREVWTITR